MIDGELSLNDPQFVGGRPIAGITITFDFRGIVLLDEATWHQSNTLSQGLWVWEASLDGVHWDGLTTVPFPLGGEGQVFEELHYNVTPYQYFRLKGISGTTLTTGAPILTGIDFRLDSKVGKATTAARDTQDVAEVAIEVATSAVRDTTDALEIVLETDSAKTTVRDTTDAVEVAIQPPPNVRVTQECIEVVLRIPPAGGTVRILPPIPLPIQQAVYDARLLCTEAWRGFWTALLMQSPPDAATVTQGLPPYPLPMQEAMVDERRLVTTSWIHFFESLAKKFNKPRLPPPVQQQLVDDRTLMTVPWALYFVHLLSTRVPSSGGGGGIDELMPNIVFVDSFDHYQTDDLHRKYALANEGLASIVPGIGRNGTSALSIAGQNDNPSFLTLAGLNSSEYYLEFGFNAGANGGSPPPGNQIIAFRDSGLPQLELRLVSTGQLAITKNGVLIQQTTGLAIGTNTWRHIGFGAVMAHSGGSVKLTIDSIPVITLTGIDTQSSPYPRITEMVFFALSNNNSVPNYFDDIIVSTDGFCGDSRVAAVFPKGPGYWNDWTPCATAYTYPQAAGDRRTEITITQNAAPTWLNPQPPIDVIDGLRNTGPQNSAGITVDHTKFVRFDFGAGASRVVNEARMWVSTFAVGPQGTWRWQGSNDAVIWTNIGAAFVLAGSTVQTAPSPYQTFTQLNGNTTGYRYYQLCGVDGSAGSGGNAWIYEFEFRIDNGGTAVPLWQNVDEHDSNEDTDYNYSATPGQRVSYDFESLGLTGNIKGVQHVVTMRKDDDRVRLVKPFTRIAGVDYDGAQISVNDTYVAQRQVWVQNPATSAQWTVSDVDNAEFGSHLIS